MQVQSFASWVNDKLNVMVQWGKILLYMSMGFNLRFGIVFFSERWLHLSFIVISKRFAWHNFLRYIAWIIEGEYLDTEWENTDTKHGADK